jgi:hypothetical protein
MLILRYPYRPRLFQMVSVILVFTICTCFAAGMALFNNGEVVLTKEVVLSPENGRLFFWGLTAFMGLFVVGGIAGAIASRKSSWEVILTDTALTAPGNLFSKAPKVVPLSGITRLETQRIQKNLFLYVYYPGGKIKIGTPFLPDNAAFDRLYTELANRTRCA